MTEHVGGSGSDEVPGVGVGSGVVGALPGREVEQHASGVEARIPGELVEVGSRVGVSVAAQEPPREQRGADADDRAEGSGSSWPTTKRQRQSPVARSRGAKFGPRERRGCGCSVAPRLWLQVLIVFQSLQVFGTTSSGTWPACRAWMPSPSPGGEFGS